MTHEVIELKENWYSWPQDVRIPAHSCFRFKTFGLFEFTYAEFPVSLECAGDRVEIVSADKGHLTEYVVV